MTARAHAAPERLPGWVITAEAAATIPDAGLAVEMAADEDPQAVLQGAVGVLAAAARGGREMIAMSWQRPFKELNPEVEQLVVKVLEEGKGAGQSHEWQTLGSVTRLDCHNPLCQRGGIDLHHTLREMVATRRAELEDVKMCRGMEAGGPGAGPRHCLNRFAFRISLAYKAESNR